MSAPTDGCPGTTERGRPDELAPRTISAGCDCPRARDCIADGVDCELSQDGDQFCCETTDTSDACLLACCSASDKPAVNNSAEDACADPEQDACCSQCDDDQDCCAADESRSTVELASIPGAKDCCADCFSEPPPEQKGHEDNCCSTLKLETTLVSSETSVAGACFQGGCCDGLVPAVAHATSCVAQSIADSACGDGCCSDCSDEQECCATAAPVLGEPLARVGALDSASNDCCSDCAHDTNPSPPEISAAPVSQGCCSDCHSPPADEPSHSRVESARDACCAGRSPVQTIRRRVVPAVSGASGYRHADSHDHVNRLPRQRRQRAGRRATHNYATGTTMGRFYEVASCCLGDWARGRRGSKQKCCGDHPSPVEKHTHRPKEPAPSSNIGQSPAGSIALELGGGRRLTMVMSIEGMDCPSCATKVTRALLSIASVGDVKVNVFAGQATLGYTDGIVFPADVARRTAELTGFACAVLHEVLPQGEFGLMRIRVPPAADVSWEKAALPSGVSVKSFRLESEGTLLDVEYNTLTILPRDVVAAFTRWHGIFVPTPKVRAGEQAEKELRALFARASISALLCLPVLVFSWAPLPSHTAAYGGASLALATIIQVYAAAPIYSAALRSLFLQHILDMDLLVVLSTSIAYVFSVVSYFLMVFGHPFSDPFFETSALLITLIILGRLLSAYARRRATSALDDLYLLQVDVVELVDNRGCFHTISTELIHKGDILHIASNTIIPTDGVVISGNSHVDESSITGESFPVEKLKGSRVTAGTTNGDGVLRMRVERLSTDNTVAEIGNLMIEVQNQRLPVQDLADYVASWLAPSILILSVITFAVWLAVGLRVRDQSGSSAAVAALRYAIAVMVISCPCALVLCVPMVVVIATAVASKYGVLFKSAEAVQTTRDVQIAVFDKTGTLTTGLLAVSETHIVDEQYIAVILGLVAGSGHPVSQAIFAQLSARYPNIPVKQFQNTSFLPGQGLECMENGSVIRGGNPSWLGLEGHAEIQKLQDAALTIFAVTINGSLTAAFGLADSLRSDAHDVVKMLEKRGIEVYIVSGDSQPVVNALAAKLDIPAARAFGGCLPQDKLSHVRNLQAGGQRTLMFVGDGTNDALALAQANVGISFSTGTSVAASAASVLLLNPSLHTTLAAILALSRGATQRIYVNFVWAFVYNTFAVLGAAGALVKVHIAPEYAGLGEMVSVVPVVLVAWSMWLLRK